MTTPTALRDQLKRFLDWGEAHADFDRVIAGIPADKRGTAPHGLPHSPWQILEHLRIAVADIHEFSVNPEYREKAWPDDYWPAAAPPSPSAWDDCVKAYRRDLDRMRSVIDGQPDLLAPIPHGTDPRQTYLRAVLLIGDHAAYHLGQLVLIRRLLGIWPGAH
jgi:hypothetical protein